jgi:hypothetical protein
MKIVIEKLHLFKVINALEVEEKFQNSPPCTSHILEKDSYVDDEE